MTRLALAVATLALFGAACTSDGASTRETSPEVSVERTPDPTAEVPTPSPTASPRITRTPVPTSSSTPVDPVVHFHPSERRTGDPPVDVVIDAIIEGDADVIIALVEVPVRPCVSGQGIDLFHCTPDMPAGAPVGRFNISSCSVNGTDDLERISSSIRRTLDSSKRIHSVTIQPEGADGASQHWVYFGTGSDDFDAATLWVSTRGTVVGLSHCGYPTVSGSWTFLLPPVE